MSQQRIAQPRILVTRLSALGDCIQTFPMVCALRTALPGAYICWLCQENFASILTDHPAVNEVITVKRRWMTSVRGVLDLRRRLRAQRFDVTIDPQSLTKSAIAAWLSGARTRIGLNRPVGREQAPFLNNRLIPPADHVIDRYLRLIEPLGVVSHDVKFELPDDQQTRSAIRNSLSSIEVSTDFLILNPGAGWPSKRWDTDSFTKVARKLHERFRLQSVITWHGKEEFQTAKRISDDSNGAAIPAMPTNEVELRELIRLARIFVGSDTGPLHLAAAVGTPCVGMFGPTLAESVGPRGPLHINLQEAYQTSSRKGRYSSNHAMRQILPSTVIEACQQILEQHNA